MKAERFDIHQHITDQIIAAIERGTGEFRLPWHRSAGNIIAPRQCGRHRPCERPVPCPSDRSRECLSADRF
jgi:antirestriction protein ArdC